MSLSGQCYSGSATYSDIDTSSATLPPLSTCSSPICFTSITQDLDLDIVQLGCWEDLSDTPRCYREAKSIICLCSTHLCNGSPPSLLPASPEITAFHFTLFVLLIFVFMVCSGANIYTGNRHFGDALFSNILQGVPKKMSHSWEHKKLGTSYSETTHLFGLKLWPQYKEYS